MDMRGDRDTSLIPPPLPMTDITGWSYSSGEPAIYADPPWWAQFVPRRWRPRPRIIRPATFASVKFHTGLADTEVMDRYYKTLASVNDVVQTLTQDDTTPAR